jgi:hypothetical protein
MLVLSRSYFLTILTKGRRVARENGIEGVLACHYCRMDGES